VQPEPVTPELVLVDPELAGRERARLTEKARLATLHVADLRRAVELESRAPPEQMVVSAPRDPGDVVRRRLFAATLTCSLFANGVLAAALVLPEGHETAVGSAPPTLGAASAGTASLEASPYELPGRSLVERKIASLVLKASPGKLPPAFIDPKTGLARNNVRVVCSYAPNHSYLCAVQRPHHDGGILVRYRQGRHRGGTFTWYGYRRSGGIDALLRNR
jgi:hypothetical protein